MYRKSILEIKEQIAMDLNMITGAFELLNCVDTERMNDKSFRMFTYGMSLFCKMVLEDIEEVMTKVE